MKPEEQPAVVRELSSDEIASVAGGPILVNGDPAP